MNPNTLVCLCLALIAAPLNGWAQVQSSTSTAPADRVTNLEHRVDALTHELEELKQGKTTLSLEQTGKTEEKEEKGWINHFEIGGYGEAVYTHFSRTQQNGSSAGKNDLADLSRAALEVEYHFNDWILADTELEVEHGGTGEGSEARGEAGVEEAFVELALADPLHIRTGLVIVPMGLTNEPHEPTTFHGVFRPNVETLIIPTTWKELGAGFSGQAGPIAYASYVMTGLQAVKNDSAGGFSGATGFEEGRTEGSRSPAESLAWVSRLDVQPVPGITVGGSLYIGEADQDLAPTVPVTLWDSHLRGAWNGWELKALYTEGIVGGAGSLNLAQIAQRAPGFNPVDRAYVGRRLFGGYAELAFNLLSVRPSIKQYLAPFVRYERYDTQSRVPAGFTNNPANSHMDYTLGLTYKPVPQVALKGDYQWLRNEALTGVNQLNLGVGYTF